MSDRPQGTVVRADLRQLYSDLIKLAAELVRGEHCLSPYSDDHPAHAPRLYWITQAEKVADKHKELAMRVRRLADDLPRIPNPRPRWVDGGYFGNGHCPFMLARTGTACCRPYQHKGQHAV